MRSQTSYPATVGLEIFETIKVFWEKGIFDDYSEKHFIIRAINNDVSYFKELFLRKNIKEINPTSFPWNFIANLNVKTVNLMQCFGNDVIENCLNQQLFYAIQRMVCFAIKMLLLNWELAKKH